MRTRLLLLAFLCISYYGTAQVPSINMNNNHKSNIFTEDESSKIAELEKKEKDLAKKIKQLKSDDATRPQQEAVLQSLIDEKKRIIEENYQYIYNNGYYNNQIAKVNTKIDKLKNDLREAANEDDNRIRINSYEKEIKALETEKERLVIERKRKLNPVSNNYNWFLPTKNREYRNAFFEDTYNNSTDKPNYLNAFSVVGSPNGVSGQSEIVADNLKMLRITFGTVITATNDSLTNENTRVEALQRLINGGGNFYFDFTLPLVTTIKGNNDDLINVYTYANIKSAADIKGYGNNIEASTYNTSLGFNFYGDVSTENKRLNFFVVAYSNYYYGCTKEFYENLGIDHNRGFLSGKITVGVTLINQFRFSANILTYGSEPGLRSEKISAGIQFLPKL